MTSHLTPAMRERLLVIAGNITSVLSDLISATRSDPDGFDDETCVRRLQAASKICEFTSEWLAKTAKDMEP